MTVLKSDLTDQIAKEFNLSGRKSTRIINAFIDSISENLSKGEKVEIRGLGTFEVYLQKGMELPDLKTGKKEKVKPYKVVNFRSSQTLKRKVNS